MCTAAVFFFSSGCRFDPIIDEITHLTTAKWASGVPYHVFMITSMMPSPQNGAGLWWVHHFCIALQAKLVLYEEGGFFLIMIQRRCLECLLLGSFSYLQTHQRGAGCVAQEWTYCSAPILAMVFLEPHLNCECCFSSEVIEGNIAVIKRKYRKK